MRLKTSYWAKHAEMMHTDVHLATLYHIDVRLRRHVPAGFTPYILAIRSKETSKIILDFHVMFSR